MNLQQIPDCLTINGKKLTQPHRNLLAKLQRDYGFDVHSIVPCTRRNRVSGVTIDDLNPLVAALVDFVYEAYDSYEQLGDGRMLVNGKNVPISLFDRTKYLVLHLDSRAYNELID
jgi:hypothetical protein